jgi:hypothetical protein
MRRSGVPLPLTALLLPCLALAMLPLHHTARPAPAAPHSQTAFAPLRVRAGASTSFTDARGAVWQSDTGASGGTAAWWYATPIEGTGDDPLYRTERYGAFGYRFGVPNETYAVTLKFAETRWKAGD